MVLSVNIGRAQVAECSSIGVTGIDKRPVTGPIEVRAPGAKRDGLGSGLVGDAVCDRRHHGGDDQAVYVYAREDLDTWATALGRPLDNGCFGENLTTAQLDVTEALIGERWRIGDALLLEVSSPRIPCRTFAGWLAEHGWIRRFTRAARPGAYLRVIAPGSVRQGDGIDVAHRAGSARGRSIRRRRSACGRSPSPGCLITSPSARPGTQTRRHPPSHRWAGTPTRSPRPRCSAASLPVRRRPRRSGPHRCRRSRA